MLKRQTKLSKATSKNTTEEEKKREGIHGHTVSYITLISSLFGVGRYKRTTAVKQRYSYNQFTTHSLNFYPISILIINSSIFTRIHYDSNIITYTTFIFIYTL